MYHPAKVIQIIVVITLKECRIYPVCVTIPLNTFAFKPINYHFMLNTNPYLHFMGNTEEALKFYRSAIGGEITNLTRYKDMPGGEKMSVHDQEKIIHASLTIGKGNMLMATDALESMGQNLTFGNNFHICVYAESEAEADKAFAALSAGGTIYMPMNRTFWGSYFGMCGDKFGVRWMVEYAQKNLASPEMVR
jgi:PhnB protein